MAFSKKDQALSSDKKELVVKFFPEKPYCRVKYSMALANAILNILQPSQERPLLLNGGRRGDIQLKYIWTALMV